MKKYLSPPFLPTANFCQKFSHHSQPSLSTVSQNVTHPLKQRWPLNDPLIFSPIGISQAKLPDQLLDALTKMGHTFRLRPAPYPSINLVLKSGDVLSSQSDGRGGGYAIKYGA